MISTKSTSGKQFSGVLLPPRLQGVFVKTAVKEKLVTLARPLREQDYKWELGPKVDEYEEKQRRIALAHLEIKLNPYHRQKVLEAILLFGKAIVASNIFFDYEALVDKGLVEIKDPEDYELLRLAAKTDDSINEVEISYTPHGFEVEKARLIRPVFEANDYLSHPGGSHWLHNFDTYCELLEELKGVESWKQIRDDRKVFYENRLGLSFMECAAWAYGFLLGIHDIENNLLMSTAKSAPLLLPISSAMRKPRNVQENLQDAQQVLATYAIFLDAIHNIPILNSFDDLSRLMKHPALPEFRRAIWRWSDAIGRGDTVDEAFFRKQITSSIAGLEKATKVKRVSRYLTLMSLPTAIASVFAQMPLGLILVPVSFSLAITAHALEHKHRWVTFGR